MADYTNKRVQKFSSDGEFLLVLETGSDLGIQGTPEGLAVDELGRVYVTDYALGRVEVFTGDGQLLTVWGARGNDDGEFRAPVAIALDQAGNAYVSDQSNNTLQKFSLH